MDIRRIPIISMSTITSLTNLMGELPLPTANPDSISQSLGYGQDVYNEATSVLNHPNKHFFDSLRKAIENTSTDEIKLKDTSSDDKLNINIVPNIFKKIVQDNPTKFQNKLGFEEFFIKSNTNVVPEMEGTKIKDKSDKSRKKKRKHKEPGSNKKAQSKLTDPETYAVAKRHNGLCLTLKKLKEVSIADNIKPPIPESEFSETQKFPEDAHVNIVFSDPNITNSSSGISANTSQSSLDLSKDTKTKIENKILPMSNFNLNEKVDYFGKSTNNSIKVKLNTSSNEAYFLNFPNDTSCLFDDKKSSIVQCDDLLESSSVGLKSNPMSNSLSAVNELKIPETTVKDSILGIDLNRSDSTNNSPSHDDDDNIQVHQKSTNQQFGLAAYLSKTNSSGNHNHHNSLSNYNENQPDSCVSVGQNSVDFSEIKTSDASLHDSTPIQQNGPNSEVSMDHESFSIDKKTEKRGRGRNKELENLMKWQIKDKGIPQNDPLDCTTVGPGERVKKRTRRCVRRNEREDGSSISENSYQTNDISPHPIHDNAQITMSLKSESSIDDDGKLSSPLISKFTPFHNINNNMDFSQNRTQYQPTSLSNNLDNSLFNSSPSNSDYNLNIPPNNIIFTNSNINTNNNNNSNINKVYNSNHAQLKSSDDRLNSSTADTSSALSVTTTLSITAANKTTITTINNNNNTISNLPTNNSNTADYHSIYHNNNNNHIISNISLDEISQTNLAFSSSLSSPQHTSISISPNNNNNVQSRKTNIKNGNNNNNNISINNDDIDNCDGEERSLDHVQSMNLYNKHDLLGHNFVNNSNNTNNHFSGARLKGKRIPSNAFYRNRSSNKSDSSIENDGFPMDVVDSFKPLLKAEIIGDISDEDSTDDNNNNNISKNPLIKSTPMTLHDDEDDDNDLGLNNNDYIEEYEEDSKLNHFIEKTRSQSFNKITKPLSRTPVNKKSKTKKSKKIPMAIKNYSQTDSRLQHLLASRESNTISRERILRSSEYNRNMNPVVLMSRHNRTLIEGHNRHRQHSGYSSDSSSTCSGSTIPFTIDEEAATKGTLLPADLEAAQLTKNYTKRCDNFKTQFFHFLDSLLKDVEELNLLNIASRNKEALSNNCHEMMPIDNAAKLAPDILNLLNEYVGKMKSFNVMNEIPVGKLVRLLTLLLVNMNTSIKVPNESKKRIQKMLQEQLVNCLDASLIALSIMISPDMPRAIFLEDIIEQATDLFRTVLRFIIYPINDNIYQRNQSSNSSDVLLNIISNISVAKSNTEYINKLNSRVQCGINCLAELMIQKPNRLTDEAVIKITSLGLSCLYVNNSTEIQLALIPLLAAVFSQYEAHRKSIIADVLNVFAQNQTKKPIKNYRINTEEEIQVITAAVLILFQSVVQKPITNKKSNNKSVIVNDGVVENTVIATVNSSLKIIQAFVHAFFKKACLKGEDSYKIALDRFVQDLFIVFNKPEWPVGNIILHSFGNTIMYHLTNAGIPSSTLTANRLSAIDLLGTICAFVSRYIITNHLRIKTSRNLSDELLVELCRSNNLNENKAESTILSFTDDEKLRVLKLLLINFLSLDATDTTCLYAKRYCIGLYLHDLSNLHNNNANTHIDPAIDNAVINVTDSKSVDEFKRQLLIQLTPINTTPIEIPNFTKFHYENACCVFRIINMTKDLDSFENYLSKISKCLDENSVPIRTKSMRSLALVLDEDPSLLAKSEIEKSVNRRFLDSSIAVREATIDLVGRFLSKKPDLVNQYYPILITRIADTGTSVRKRVIQVLWEICSAHNDFPHVADAYAKIMRRFYDEESVKKLVNEVFKSAWFTPLSDREPVKLQQRIFNIADVIHSFSSDQKYNHNAVLQFITQLCKAETEQNNDSKSQKIFEKSLQQIIECLVQTVLRLQEVSGHSAEVANTKSNPSSVRSLSNNNNTNSNYSNNNSNSGNNNSNSQQQKMLCSTWNALHIFAKVRPKLVWPYLGELSSLLRQIRSSNSLKQTLLINNEMATCMNHLCGTLDSGLAAAHGYSLEHSQINLSKNNLNDIANDLINLAINAPKRFIVDSAIKCLCRVTGFTKDYSSVQAHFSRYYNKVLNFADQLKNHSNQQSAKEADSKRTLLFRMSFTSVVFWRYFDKKDLLGKDLEHRSESIFSDLLDVTMLFAKNREFRDRLVSNMNHLVHKDHNLLIKGPIHDFYISTLKLVQEQQKLSADTYKTISLILENISNFLKHNELKMMEEHSNWRVKNQQESLKETHDIISSFGNVVAQKYLDFVLDCCMVQGAEVRANALNLICKILGQGLVQPLTTVAHLIALQGDTDQKIKFKADTQLNELNNKYQGYVPVKALSGIRLSFRLQKIINDQSGGKSTGVLDGVMKLKPVRGWCSSSTVPQSMMAIANNNTTTNLQAVNHQLYTMLRKSKQHWRSFLDGIISFFDDSNSNDLEERIFIADQLATFPYQIQEEPVFIVHRLNMLISVSGQTMLRTCKEVFKQLSKPIADRAYKDGELSQNELTILVKLLAETSFDSRKAVYNSIKTGKVVMLLIGLRDYLKLVYGLVESKLTNYSPSQTNKHLDKPTSRCVNAPLFELPSQCLIKLPDINRFKSPNNDFINIPNPTTNNMLNDLRQMLLDYMELRNTLMKIEAPCKNVVLDENSNTSSSIPAVSNSVNKSTNKVPVNKTNDAIITSNSKTKQVNESGNNSTKKLTQQPQHLTHSSAILSSQVLISDNSMDHITEPTPRKISRSSSSSSTVSSIRLSSKKRPKISDHSKHNNPRQTNNTTPVKKELSSGNNSNPSSTNKSRPSHINNGHKPDSSTKKAAAPRLTLTNLPSDFLGTSSSVVGLSNSSALINSTNKHHNNKPSTNNINSTNKNNINHNKSFKPTTNSASFASSEYPHSQSKLSSTSITNSTSAATNNNNISNSTSKIPSKSASIMSSNNNNVPNVATNNSTTHFPRRRLFKSSVKTMPNLSANSNNKRGSNNNNSHHRSTDSPIYAKKSKKRKLQISSSSDSDDDDDNNDDDDDDATTS